MIIGFTGFSFKGSAPSCPANGTYLRTEGCNDIYADGICGEYSVDNGSCPNCDGCDTVGTYLRTDGCNDFFADGCCGEYSQDNGSCSCDDLGVLDHTDTVNSPTIIAGNTCGVYDFTFAYSADRNFYADGNCGSYWDGLWVNIVGELNNGDTIGGFDGGDCQDWCWIYYDNSSGQPSYTYSLGHNDSGNCNSCDGCDSAGTLESTGTGYAWANTVDADGTDWNINYQDNQYADGCCGTYSERHWYAFFDTSPVELSSPDGGVSPNPPAGYVLTASAIYPEEGFDSYTYASYADDEEWTIMTWLLTAEGGGYNGYYPFKSYKVVAYGNGGSTNEQTVQDAGTVMSDVFVSPVNSSVHARFYSTGTTYDDSTNGSHPSFDIISCPAYGTYIETLATGVDWTIEITLESLGTPYSLRVGTKDIISVTDGACGTESIDDNYTPESFGTLLYTESISAYLYYSDGAGGYYTTFEG